MSIGVESWLTDLLYDMLYVKLRRQYFGLRTLSQKTRHKVVQQNLTTLNEREKYFIRLWTIHAGSINHVTKDADVTYKRARRTTDIAIRKLMSPECLVNAKVIPEFKHKGDELCESRVLSKQTVKRLAQNQICTDDDLMFWYEMGPKFLFRIPDIGTGRIIEILSHLNDKNLI